MNPRIAARLAGLCPTAVNRVLHDVRQVQAAGKDVVSLLRGQPDTPTPMHIIEAAERALRDGRTGYPDNQGEPGLRQAVAEYIHGKTGQHYDPDREILITDGATSGIATALAALVQPGDDALLPDPIYDAYASVILFWGARPVPVHSVMRRGRFTFGRDELEAACTPGTSVLLINSPWNPVGTVLLREELDSITGFAAAHDLFVISDEIYDALAYDRTPLSAVAQSEDARRRTLLVNSLSKTYAMTGWRVGYCAGPADVIRAMLLALQQYSRGPATFVQDAAACALRSDQECVRRMAAEYRARRDRVVECLRGIRGVEPLVPEGGLFVMVDVRGLGMPSAAVREFLLREAGVALIEGAAYGPSGEGTLRVSFAAGGATLERGLERLRSGLLRLAGVRT
jgi:aspartate/methionine/tyrosine aminotransferase